MSPLNYAFRCVIASLKEGLSVHPSVDPSVRPLVRPLVCYASSNITQMTHLVARLGLFTES